MSEGTTPVRYWDLRNITKHEEGYTPKTSTYEYASGSLMLLWFMSHKGGSSNGIAVDGWDLGQFGIRYSYIVSLDRIGVVGLSYIRSVACH
jgi:hypothetical protein